MQRLWALRPNLLKTPFLCKKKLHLDEAGQRLNRLTQNFRSSLKEEHRRYKEYYRSLESKLSSLGTSGTSTLKQNLTKAKALTFYHLKHTSSR